MRRLYPIFFFIIIANFPVTLCAQENINHNMKVAIEPEKHLIYVKDTITLPESFLKVGGGEVHFILHEGLQPVSKTDGATVTLFNEKTQSESDADSIFQSDSEIPEHYIVNLPAPERSFILKYKGEIYHPLQNQEEDSNRSFSETPGIISAEGVYLAASSYWYPWFSDDPVTFSMEVELPQGWKAVSQGGRATTTIRHGKPNWTVSEGKPPEGLRPGMAEIKRAAAPMSKKNFTKPRIRRYKNRNETPPKKTQFYKFVIQYPQDEIYLVAGKFTEYNSQAGTVQTLVFLRHPDQKLADKYLETGSQYLKMYSKLLGPYPYKKFAIAENFWETGYGMPSFTLLGSKIIRFPFILHSSYPHEILHNWWGNGVFVDFSFGNWSEGLTAYLSDHLIKEQQGQGKEYRRSTLQKYTDYVAESKDFPLTEFRSRHSAATEAVGYGKTMMFFHMLRLQLGDEVFINGLQKFYQEYKFKRATFENLKEVFSDVSGKDLQIEFDQWIKQTGAPEIRISNVAAWQSHNHNSVGKPNWTVSRGKPPEGLRPGMAENHNSARKTELDGFRLSACLPVRNRTQTGNAQAGKKTAQRVETRDGRNQIGYRPEAQTLCISRSKKKNQTATKKLYQKNKISQINNTAAAGEKGYQLTAVLKQVQEGTAYTLQIPIAVILKDSQEAYQTTVIMNSKRSEISLHVPSEPLRLDVDPEFDLFRRLHRNETPPTLSRAFGSEKALIILPSTASQDFFNEYRKLAELWQISSSEQMEIKLDNEIEKIPEDRTVWLFGKKNRFKSKIIGVMTDYNVLINDTAINIGQNEVKIKDHSIIFTTKHPDKPDFALVWISTDNAAAIQGLGRKLPHYGKYSYLAFEGDEPSLALKGQWPAAYSPMSVLIPKTDSAPLSLRDVTRLAPRKALAYLPAAFLEDRMIEKKKP